VQVPFTLRKPEGLSRREATVHPEKLPEGQIPFSLRKPRRAVSKAALSLSKDRSLS